MVVFKFEKTSTSALAAHVDTLRAVTYVFRRAGLDVEYSQGFNPHMELGFSAPLALGVESVCEYVSAKMQYEEGLVDKLNAVCPQGIKFTKAFDKSVNLAAKINRATYRVEAQGIGEVVEEILAPNYEISYEERGTTVTKNVANRIYTAQIVHSNCAFVTLAVGNDNLRPDRLVCYLQAKHGLLGDYKITKIESYVDDVPTDEYLNRLQ